MTTDNASSERFVNNFNYKGEPVAYEVWKEPNEASSLTKYRLINDEKFITFIWYDAGNWKADTIFDQEYLNAIGRGINAAQD